MEHGALAGTREVEGVRRVARTPQDRRHGADASDDERRGAVGESELMQQLHHEDAQHHQPAGDPLDAPRAGARGLAHEHVLRVHRSHHVHGRGLARLYLRQERRRWLV